MKLISCNIFHVSAIRNTLNQPTTLYGDNKMSDYIDVTAKGMKLTDALRTAAEKAVFSSTKRFKHLRMNHASVVIDVSNQNNKVSIYLSAAGRNFYCFANEGNIYKSLATCKTRLKRKLKQSVAKRKRRKSNIPLKHNEIQMAMNFWDMEAQT